MTFSWSPLQNQLVFLLILEFLLAFFNTLWNSMSSTPPIWFYFYRVVIEMCLASSILKKISSGWIRKYQVLLFFMLRQLKITDSLRNSDEVAWNFAISEGNLFRSSQNSFYKTFLKNFVKFTEKDLCQSLLFKTFFNFKRRFWLKCFPLNSETFLKHIFLRNAFRSLLLLLEKPLRNPWEINAKPTTRILLQ